jgi:uncharacterized protein (DUF1800 family)
MRNASRTPTPLDKLDPTESWEPWEPSSSDPWNRKWAGHLFRRAAFGATWPQLEAAVADGMIATVDRMLNGGEGQDEFDRVMDSLAPESARFQPQDRTADVALQGWWLHRMLRTSHPLRERMTLFWHNHFATSILKVRQATPMARQNILIRSHALGKFGPFLLEMSRDPAMLIWLDSNSNSRGRPNENYARELMELFSLGVGRYTESDVREAARAFTGWHTDGKKFTLNNFQHDGGKKTLLGQTGNLDGADVVRIVLEQPAAAEFLIRKVYRAFISEGDPPPDRLLAPLADRYRASGYDAADLMRTILQSRLFFSSHAFRQRVKSPVEYAVGLLRGLEAKPTETQSMNLGGGAGGSLGNVMDGLGQTLFAPPNVKGWNGGESWLNSATLLARHNLAWKVVQGAGAQSPLGVKVNPAALVRKYVGKRDAAGQVGFLLELLLQPGEKEVDAQRSQKLVEFLGSGDLVLDDRLRETVHAALLMPEFQLS